MNKTLLYALVITHVIVTIVGIYFTIASTEDTSKLNTTDLKSRTDLLAVYKWLGPSMIAFGVIGGGVSGYFLSKSMGSSKFGFKLY